MKKTNQSPVGTSYHDCTITATVNELKAILGEPVHSENDGEDKVNFEWNMETNEGDVFTVYDWKEYRKISEDEKINWHIGGKSGGITIQAQAELATALTTPVKDAGQSDKQEQINNVSVEMLIEALNPFAEMCREFTSTKIRQGGTVFQYNDKHLKVADFEKAEQVINYLSHHPIK